MCNLFAGSNKLSTVLTPTISANGLRFKDLEVAADGEVSLDFNFVQGGRTALVEEVVSNAPLTVRSTSV